MGVRKAHQPAKKRPVIINGVYCSSLTEASRFFDLPLWKIQRLVNGDIKIEGIIVSGINKTEIYSFDKSYNTLLSYPVGLKPIDRGLHSQWR